MNERPLRLTIERRNHGWSRAELARRAGMNAATITLIENGRFIPYPSQLRKLAEALGVATDSPESLLEAAGSDEVC